MKKLFLVLVLTALPVFADDNTGTVYLDLNAGEEHGYKIFNPSVNDLNIKQEEKDNEDYIYRPMEYIKSEARELYSKKNFSHKKEKKFGKATFGAKHNTTLEPDNLSQKQTIYSKYDLTEKMSVNGEYQTNFTGDPEAQAKGTIGVGPEYKLNKKLKLKNKYSKNLGDNSNKGEVSIEYKPFKDDRMDFNAGAAQIQQDDGTGSHSQVNFGTNFKF